jgi:methyl-accepting chemotaxis protein
MLHVLENAKISTKLNVITILSIALFSILVGWAIYSLNLNKKGLNSVAEAVHKTAVATEAQIGTKEIGIAARNLYLARTSTESTIASNKTLYYLNVVDEKLAQLRNMQHTNNIIELIDKIRDLWHNYTQITKNSIKIELQQIEQQAIFFTLGEPLSKKISELINFAEKNDASAIAAIYKIELALSQRRTAIWRYLATYDETQIQAFENQITAFNKLITECENIQPTTSIRAKLNVIKHMSNEYNKIGNEVIKLHNISTDLYFNKATKMRSQAGNLIDNLVKDIVADETLIINNITATSIATSNGLIGIGIIIAILLLSAMTIVGRMITQPINRLSGLVEKLAAGNFDVNVDDTERGDEIGLMARSISNMICTLGQLLHELRSLITNAKAGDFSINESVTELKGDYAEVIVGTNELLKTLTTPLIEIVEVMQRLSVGNLKKRMQGNYQGDLQVFQSNVNRSLDDLLNLLKVCYRTQELSRTSKLYDTMTKKPRVQRTDT